jgi:hypothetical protein
MKANTYGVKKKVSFMQASSRIKVVSTFLGQPQIRIQIPYTKSLLANVIDWKPLPNKCFEFTNWFHSKPIF